MQLAGAPGLDPAFLPRAAPRAGMGLRPRRGPRPEEVALMRNLAAGPRAVTEGPIGRCVKRGWCRAVMAEGGARGAAVSFALTDLGRALIG